MKLKTLKGLELGIGEHEEIRAEAVKWVMFYDREAEPARANAIMDFFNITEEDLK